MIETKWRMVVVNGVSLSSAEIWSDLLGTYVLICGEMGAFVGGSVLLLLLLLRVLFFPMDGGRDC